MNAPTVEPGPGPDSLTIPAAAVAFRSKAGSLDFLETSSAPVLLARLYAAFVAGETVTRFEQRGLLMTGDSIAALNCYGRSARIGRCGLPWHASTVTRNRHDWAALVAHLGLIFQ